MTIVFNVPSIACEVCAKNIREGIKKQEPLAEVEVDVPSKKVTVTTSATENTLKEIILSLGHELA